MDLEDLFPNLTSLTFIKADPNYAFIIVNNNAGEANSLKPKEKKKMGSFVALDSLSRDSLDDKAFLAARVDATPTDIDNMMSNSDVSASDIQKKNTPSGSSSSSPTKKQKHATPGTIKTKDLNNAHHQLQRRPDFKSPAVKYNELFLHLEFIYDINKSGNHKENKDVTTYVEKTISSLKMEAMRGNAAKARQFLFFHDPDSPVSRDVLTYVRQNLIEPNPLYDLVVQEAGPNQKQLKLIAHCMDDRELKELVSLSYLTRDEALQISRDGKVEIMVSLLEQHFSTIYPTPALFSPLNGCMSSSLNLDKVKAAINISPEWSDPNWAATGPPSTETRRISADTTPLFSPIPPSQQQQQRTIEKNSALNMSKSSVNSQYSVGSADVKYHQLQNFNNTSVFSLGNNNDISGGGVGKANSKTSIGSRTNSQESSKVSLPAAAAAQQQGQARQFLFFHDASNSMSVKVLKYLQEKLPKSDLAVEEMGPTDRDLKLIAHCIDDQELKEWVALGYLSRADMFQCANGRIDPIVKLLKEEFKVIFPRPALFSPLNGCMTGSLNLEKVVSMISSSSDWADPASALSSPAVRTARSSNSSSSLPVSPKK